MSQIQSVSNVQQAQQAGTSSTAPSAAHAGTSFKSYLSAAQAIENTGQMQPRYAETYAEPYAAAPRIDPSLLTNAVLAGSSSSAGGGMENMLGMILMFLLMDVYGEEGASTLSASEAANLSGALTSASYAKTFQAASADSGWNASSSVTTRNEAIQQPAYNVSAIAAGSGYDQIVQSALTRLGDPYSQSKAGQADYTDCSYLSRWCYRAIGVEIPRTAAAQAEYCVKNKLTVSENELQPGDLIFYSLHDNDRFMDITHVGIYAGSGMMVDASSINGKVVYRQVFNEGKVLYGRPR